MATAIPPRSIAAAKTIADADAEDHAWRGRTLAACTVLGLGVLGVGASRLDWSAGPALALGQLAGLVSPLAAIGLAAWAGAAFAARRR